jgi:hypothetical protein
MADGNKILIDRVSRQSGIGELSSAVANNLLGFNHRGMGNPIPSNKDGYGLTFFTRPFLNLSYDNISQVRKLTPLLNNSSSTYQRVIRTLLDPIGARPDFSSKGANTRLVDTFSPFIPILSNNILSMSGWPDIAMDTYTSKPGIQREAWVMADGTSKLYDSFDIQVSFRNVEGDPITLLFLTWLHYISGVYDGSLMPYPEFIMENRIDYQTRIYRLILDSTKQYVQKIAACGAAFPYSSSIGAAFNFSSDKVFNSDSDQINVPFKCIGADYNDPVTIEEFNAVGVLANKDLENPGTRGYVKLHPRQLTYFNYYGYPQINPKTFELEWWVPQEVFAQWNENYANNSYRIG